jgi:hypothetical protein
VLRDPPGVVERPEVVDSLGIRVLDRELHGCAAGGHEELVVLDRVAFVSVEGVGVGIELGDVGVEPEVDVALVVPLGVVDRDGRFGQFPLRELLDQDAVVERLAFVRDDSDVGVGRALSEGLRRGAPRDPVADDYVRRGHTRSSTPGVM